MAQSNIVRNERRMGEEENGRLRDFKTSRPQDRKTIIKQKLIKVCLKLAFQIEIKFLNLLGFSEHSSICEGRIQLTLNFLF